MGYESKLVVVDKSDLFTPDDDGKVWAEKIADVRLSVIDGDVLRRIKKYPVASCYYYEHGSEDKVVEDFYGEELTEVPLKDMISILKDAEEMSSYRRYKIAIGLLESFSDYDWDTTNNIVVLHFGY
jgi:hypothetical protein